MAALKEVGERKLVENICGIVRPRSPDTVLGIGDDAAVLGNLSDGSVVVSTDVVTKERHFPKGMTFERFGWTAAAVNFSDIASMGARPIGFLPAITMPEDSDESELYDIVSGIDQCCEFCNADVIGGDTKFGQLAIAGTALGTLEGRKPLVRSGARPGDIVAVTGSLGGAAAGYLALENGICADDSVLSLMAPVPRVEEGVKISRAGCATSCMDLSDGLAAAAKEVCKQSHVGMEIEWGFLPIGEGVEDVCKKSGADLRDAVVRWGGEYELLFTFDEARIQRLYDVGLAFSIIGKVTNGNGPMLCEYGEGRVMGDAVY